MKCMKILLMCAVIGAGQTYFKADANQIVIKLLGGKELTFDIENGKETVLGIKHKIAKEYRCSVFHQRLVYNGRYLQNEEIIDTNKEPWSNKVVLVCKDEKFVEEALGNPKPAAPSRNAPLRPLPGQDGKSKNESFKVKVSPLMGGPFLIDVYAGETALDVKKRIAEKERYTLDLQWLIDYNGKVIENGNKVYKGFPWTSELTLVVQNERPGKGLLRSIETTKPGVLSKPAAPRIPASAAAQQHDVKAGIEQQALEIGSATAIGIVKDEPDHQNEDFIRIDANNKIFGVFDGNGKSKKLLKEMLSVGSDQQATQQLGYDFSAQFDPDEVARFVGNTLPERLLKAQGNVAQIKDIFGQLNKEIRPRCIMGSGTTAVLAHIIGNTLHVINLGDSRAVLFAKNRNPQQLSEDSKAVFNFGSDVFNTNKVHVVSHQLTSNDEFLVLMSDGIANILDNNEIAQIMRSGFAQNKSPNQVAQNVIDKVRRIELSKKEQQEKMGKTYKIDDSAIVIIRFNKSAQPAQSAALSKTAAPSRPASAAAQQDFKAGYAQAQELAQLQTQLVQVRKEKVAANELVAQLLAKGTKESDEEFVLARIAVEGLQYEQNRIQRRINQLENKK